MLRCYGFPASGSNGCWSRGKLHQAAMVFNGYIFYAFRYVFMYIFFSLKHEISNSLLFMYIYIYK